MQTFALNAAIRLMKSDFPELRATNQNDPRLDEFGNGIGKRGAETDELVNRIGKRGTETDEFGNRVGKRGIEAQIGTISDYFVAAIALERFCLVTFCSATCLLAAIFFFYGFSVQEPLPV